MRYGPVSIQRASVLAKGLRRPKLSTNIKIGRQMIGDEESYVIKLLDTNTYNRYGAMEFSVLQLCDGTRTPTEIAEEFTRRNPDSPLSEQEVLEFLDSSDPNLWEKSLGERNIAVLERIREERKSQLDRSSMLYMTVTGWDPDKLLNRIHPYLKWMYTRMFVIASIGLFLLTAILIAGDYTRIRQDTVEFYNFTNKTAYDLWIFWFLLLVVSGFHEFGHGLTCKHFGGEVHSMGLLLIYFTPAFYTETSDQLLFDTTAKKEWVIFAGIWIELVMCGVATLGWAVLPPGSFMGDLCYKTLLMTGVSGVFFNLNPLMKFDGYYALAQYLQMDNLREDSFDYLKVWLQRYILRRQVDLPSGSRKTRLILLAYSVAATCYSAFILVLVFGWAKNIFLHWFGDWGYLATLGLIYLMLRKKIHAAMPAIRVWLLGWREKYMAWKMTRLQQAGGVAVVLFLVAWPTATTTSSDFLLEPIRSAEVRATETGWIRQIPVRQGDHVAAGTILAVLSDHDLETRTIVAQREFALANRALLAARDADDTLKVAQQMRERQRLETEVNTLQEKLAELVLRAPFAGVVITPQLELRMGTFLNEGDTFATVVDRQNMKARILVRDWELEDVRPGYPVKLNLLAFPYRSYTGTVQEILPAAAEDVPVGEHKLVRYGQETTNYFAVIMDFPNSDGKLVEGLTGTAKIYGNHRPIAWRTGRAAYRWIRSLIW